ncbi:hypothetical protein AVEN_47781-1 [Araneus ventricosus]|uniref:Uncharacterized protein n=1 Tax=Araneus ventricosus TaxID=182803 RepID=A0A4Y2S383_ARAVE|nr:hypothetical protein AVEN_47781-1 [Araneus ventricosus]
MEDNRRKVIIEEHISLVKGPGSEYIGHVSVNFERAQIIGNKIYSFLSGVNNDRCNKVGCDGTSVNIGVKGGIIRYMGLILNRLLQWFVRQLHAKKLPLRHIFAHVDRTTPGPRSLTGEIRKSLARCEKLSVV